MSLDADTIVDRRRMRRKLTFWRVLAVLVAICAVVAAGAALRVPGTSVLTGAPGSSIGIWTTKSPITSSSRSRSSSAGASLAPRPGASSGAISAASRRPRKSAATRGA